MKKVILYIFIVSIICLFVGYFFVLSLKKTNPSIQSLPEIETSNQQDQKSQPTAQEVKPETTNPQDKSKTETVAEKQTEIIKKIQQEVPFFVQAPLGNWSDPDFQNACEEASAVMAMGWVKDEKIISAQEANKRMLEVIAFENKTFGYSTDTNVFDMEKIFRQFFKHEDVHAQEDITLEDIKAEIQKGNVVIVPAFGRALKNPNFTQPGPVAHMLVIVGYDPTTKQFITNDPGTRKGAGYKYDETLLFDAIWEYASGKIDPPLPTPGKMKKSMISISK